MISQHSVETRCNDCIFLRNTPALWDCHLNLLGKFKDQGFDCEIDEEDNYRVLGKACWYYRTKVWAKANKIIEDKSLLLDEEEIEKAKEKVEKEVHLSVDTIIYFEKDKTLDDLKRTINSIEQNTYKPKHIYIVNMGNTPPSRMLPWGQNNINLPYNIEFILGDREIGDSLNLVFKKTKNVYVSVIEAGEEVQEDYYEKINKLIYKEMERVLMIAPPIPSSYNYLFILKLVAKQLGYNSEKSLMEKMQNVCEMQNRQFLIKEHKEIFNES